MDTHVRRRLVVGGALAAALGGAAGCSSDSGDASVHTTPNAGADTGRSPSSSPTPKPPTHAELIVAENAKPGDPLWRIPEDQVAAESALTGYTSVASAVPGDRVGLHVRAAAPFTVTAYRIGYYAGVGGRQVWASAEFPATQQPQPRLDEGRMVVAGWSKTLELDTTGWPEGSYLLALRSQGKGRYVPLTMRATDTKDRVAVVNPTTTWQAYNTFGGFSLYVGANGQPKSVRVSFDRPYENNALHFILDELPYVQLAEQHGIPVAYLNSEDLERPGILAGALGVVSGGHDEYWSVPMREAVTVARDAGTNVAFLGGNEIYWRVRFESDNRVVVGYKQSAGADPVKNDPTTTGLWRQAPHPNPEVSLTGQMYECYPVSGPWVVHTPDFFLYEGTGVTKGTSFSNLIGVESNRAYPVAGSPPNLQVVAHGEVACGQGRSFHDATYYSAPSGAGVFAVGTINWANVVGGNAGDAAGQAFARAVTVNLLKAMAAGPMGKAHPSVPNLAELGASPSTANGTGGDAIFVASP